MIRFADSSFYKKIIDQARDIIFVVAPNGAIVAANLAASIAYGYTQEELLQLNVRDLRAPSLIEGVDDQILTTHSQGILFRTLNVRKDGSQFPVEVSSRSVLLGENTVLVSILRDVSSSVEAEQELRNKERELTALNEQLTAAYEELSASEEELRQQLEELIANEEQIRRHNILLTSMHKTAIGLIQRVDINEVLAMIVTYATAIVGTPHGFIYRLDKEQSVFRRTHGLGMYQKDIGRQIPLNQGVVGAVYRTGEPMVVNDYEKWRELYPASAQFPQIRAVLQIPLKSEGQVIGTIGLSYAETNRTFGDEEVQTLERFAEIASIALDNAVLVTSYKREISERTQAEADLLALINALPDQIYILRRDGSFINAKCRNENPNVLASGHISRNIAQLLPVDIVEKAFRSINLAIDSGTVQVLEYEDTIHGKLKYFEARVIAGGEDEVIAIIRDVTERKMMERQLEHLSLHDALTGIYNRSFFEEEMKRFSKSRHSTAGLIVCDVDGLKMINDSLGHDVGDSVLKRVAKILQKAFRSEDIVARIGGDEFAVLIPTNSPKVLGEDCQRILDLIESCNQDNPTVPISLSVGFSVSKQQPLDMAELFKEADNQMYREKLHRQNSARSAIVKALMKALEERDFITEGHGERLQDLIEGLAGAVGLSEQRLADIRLLARFHDIGKVGIPDHILFKAGSLNEREWAIMRQHCEIGCRIARSVPDLSPIADWILKHQEWWNGKGYPLGIAGEEIPIECRMLSIVDAYDAMTSDRPYRQAMNQEAAIAELRRCAGVQFDPSLVERFLSYLENRS